MVEEAPQELKPTNPLRCLSYIRQADIDLKIANQFVTPVDQSNIIQTLNHPYYSHQVISVHKVNKNCVPKGKPPTEYFGSQK